MFPPIWHVVLACLSCVFVFARHACDRGQDGNYRSGMAKIITLHGIADAEDKFKYWERTNPLYTTYYRTEFGEKTMTTTIKALSASNDNLNKSSSKNLFKSLSRWMKISGISRSLYQLDDRTLNDIGICRGDIRAYAIRIVDNDNKTAA
jgi:uncharacterized protein YjiS (DUF1127 family)